MTWVHGLDISHYQNDKGPVDWRRVVSAGVRFVIAAGGDGFYRDPYLAANVGGPLAAGAEKVECYKYLRFELRPDDMVAEIMHTHDVAVAEGMHPDWLTWLDIEDVSPYNSTLTAEQRIAWLLAVTAKLDIPHGIYSGGWYWRPDMANSGFWHKLPLWTGQYPYADQQPPDNYPGNDDEPALYGGWPQATVWQYTSSGRVPGIAGAVDLNAAQPGYLGGTMGMTPAEMARLERLERLVGGWKYTDPQGNVLTGETALTYLDKVVNRSLAEAARLADVALSTIDSQTLSKAAAEVLIERLKAVWL